MRVSSPPVTGPVLLRHRHAVARGADRREQHASTRSPRTSASTSLGYLSLDGMLESVPVWPARLLSRLFLRRLSDAAADRSRQAAIRLRLLTAHTLAWPLRHGSTRTPVSADTTATPPTPKSVYFFGDGQRRGHEGHEGRPRRQGREPRRDDESRRARSAGLHDRLRALRRAICASDSVPDALRDGGRRRARSASSRSTGKDVRRRERIRCSSRCAPARRSRCPGMMETILNLGLNDRHRRRTRARERQRTLRVRLVSPLHPDVRRRRARRALRASSSICSPPSA